MQGSFALAKSACAVVTRLGDAVASKREGEREGERDESEQRVKTILGVYLRFECGRRQCGDELSEYALFLSVSFLPDLSEQIELYGQ